MKTIKCVICGQNFTTSRPNKKYCSFSCKMAAEEIGRMKRKAEQPTYYRDYMRQYRNKQKEAAANDQEPTQPCT